VSQLTRANHSRTITQINSNQYLIEGECDYARLGFEIDESFLTYAEFEGGPLLHINRDFWGKGLIEKIEPIDSGKDGYMIIKVTLNQKEYDGKTIQE
jgi:hypothetical protein